MRRSLGSLGTGIELWRRGDRAALANAESGASVANQGPRKKRGDRVARSSPLDKSCVQIALLVVFPFSSDPQPRGLIHELAHVESTSVRLHPHVYSQLAVD